MPLSSKLFGSEPSFSLFGKDDNFDNLLSLKDFGESSKPKKGKKGIKNKLLEILPFALQALTTKQIGGVEQALQNFLEARRIKEERQARIQEIESERSFRSKEAEKERTFQSKENKLGRIFRSEEGETERKFRSEEAEKGRDFELEMRSNIQRFESSLEEQRQEHSKVMASLGRQHDLELQERTFGQNLSQQFISTGIDPTLAKSLGDRLAAGEDVSTFTVDDRLALNYFQQQIEAKTDLDRLNAVTNLLRVGSQIPVQVTRPVRDPESGQILNMPVTDRITGEPAMRPRMPSEFLSILGPKARESLENLGAILPDNQIPVGDKGETVATLKADASFSEGKNLANEPGLKERAKTIKSEEELALFMDAIIQESAIPEDFESGTFSSIDEDKVLGVIDSMPWDENKKMFARNLLRARINDLQKRNTLTGNFGF